jgi:hypothetical protein
MLLDEFSGHPCAEDKTHSDHGRAQISFVLSRNDRMEVNVVNPRRERRFAESLGERSKTDPVDAHVLCQYAVRMPWGSLGSAQRVGLTLAWPDSSHRSSDCYADAGEKSSAFVAS